MISTYGLTICMVIRIANPYVRQILFCTSLLLWRRKSTKIRRILLTNARTPLETKYASKPPLTEATYTKSRKFYGKKWRYINEKFYLLFTTENTIRVFSAFSEIAGCPSKDAGCSKQFPISFPSSLFLNRSVFSFQ